VYRWFGADHSGKVLAKTKGVNYDFAAILNRNAVASSSPGLPLRLPWDHG